MRGGNEINIVSTFFLKLKKNFRKAPDRNEFSCLAAAYFPVLTKNAAHCAAGEKHRACAMFSHQTRFLPLV